MKFKAYASILAIIFLVFFTGCGGSNSTPPAITITATAGSGQGAAVGTAFATNLQATVMQGTTAVSGATVTFAAPSSGASGTFAGSVNTATTNASGVATAAVFTANDTLGAYTVTASTTGATATASFSLTNTVGPPATITATSGTPQSAAINTTFAPFVATVVDSLQNPVSGVTVTFTAPSSGASGTFAGGVNTATTNAKGVAVSPVFTANGTTGTYTVTANTTPTVATAASFSLTNNAQGSSSNYSFYLSGLEALNNGPNFYALAGSVTLDTNGNVLAGEQDYNDVNGFTFAGDTITGGSLIWVDAATGQGTLSLNTSNAALGNLGTETLGVQFVNTNHALVVQFDGTATSSGSMDLQTLPSTLSGGYAFTLSGEGPDNATVAIGGVLSITGTALQGVFDINDAGTAAPVLDTAFSGTISAADGFGRGTISGADLLGTTPTALVYYVVGPEAIRIIDVDTADSVVGSAFGQGAGSFSNASLPVDSNFVFGVASNSWGGHFYAAAGMFTVPSSGTFTGVGDDDEESVIASDKAISGTYSIPASSSICGAAYSGASYNGYGCLIITPGDLGDVSALGIYMTDPTLNLSDPNNTTSGLGGALLADLDSDVVGRGVLIPQTDPAKASFAGNYAFGAQDYNGLNPSSGWEFDFVGQGAVTDLAFGSGTAGLLSDPFLTLDSGNGDPTYSGATFSGTAVADTNHQGRYTIPLVIDAGAGSPVDLSVVIYQASGGELFWLSEDSNDLFFGSLQQQGSLTGLPAAKTKPKQKP